MQDRQDIDALLMGALYGELSHAESTRLEAHMAAHPQDRLVLDGLTRARKAVRDSHVLAVHAEPPAAVSAMVLQEAARRAPARRAEHPGAVARFLAAFTAAFRHPAMGAAAVVVVVAGVAGTLYLRGDRQAMNVEREIAAPTAAGAPTQAAEAPPPEPARSEGVLALAPPAKAGEADALADPEATAGERGYVAALEEKAAALKETQAQAAQPPTEGRGKLGDKRPAPARSRGIAVTTAEPTIKLAPTGGKRSDDDGLSVDDSLSVARGTFSQQPPPVAASPADSTTVAVDSGPRNQLDMRLGGDAPASDREHAKRAAPAAPPAARPQVAIGAGGGSVAPGAAASAGKPADVVAKKNADAARALHRKLVELVKANKCDLASKAGADLYGRYPDYYAEFVKNDRAVKACRPHIENENRKRRAQNMKTRVQGDSYEAEAPSPASAK